MNSDKKGGRNDDHDWDKFAAQDYDDHNYGHILETDRKIAHWVIDKLSELRHRWARTAIDVGSGGALRTLALTAPLLHPNARTTFCDVGKKQIEVTKQGVINAQSGKLGRWGAHQADMAAHNPAWDKAIERVCSKAEVKKLSVFDLPTNSYDIVTAGHSLDSLTGHMEEFEKAFGCCVKALRPNGLFLMLTMIGSNGYMVGKEFFPAVSITIDDIKALAKKYGLLVHGGLAVKGSSHEHARSADDPTTYWGFGAVSMTKPGSLALEMAR